MLDARWIIKQASSLVYRVMSADNGGILNGLLASTKRKVMLFAACASLAVMVVTVVVPFASGGSTPADLSSSVMGVSDNQSSIVQDTQMEERLVQLEGAVDQEQLSQVSLAALREELEYVDQADLQKAIEEKQKAEETAQKLKIQAQQAEKERSAAAAAAAAKEAQQAKEKAEQASKKAEDTAVQAAALGNDWNTVVASCYYDVGLPIANGGILGENDLIIAHKTLPLGTKVELEYRGKKVRATVQDRGPYINGRDIDLAPGVQSALGLYDGVTQVKMRLIG